MTPSTRRPLPKLLLQWIRRGHLYLGLFLFPWAVLYGATGFLFNHPTAFSDQATTTFGPQSVAGTPLETVPTLIEQAEQVVKLLNETQKPDAPYLLASGEVKYGREFAFATVKADGQTINVLIDPKHNTGTIRATPDKPIVEVPKAPFAIGASTSAKPTRSEAPAKRPDVTLLLPDPLHERFKAAVPVILDRNGFGTTGEVTVTSVPDLVFKIQADDANWWASYNPMTGSLTGKPADGETKPELGVRRFLTRLHLAHGYPSETNARWSWAVIVDAMSFVLCFWGVSGLLMWWQIKATRKLGAIVLVLSAIAATTLGFAMHAEMVS